MPTLVEMQLIPMQLENRLQIYKSAIEEWCRAVVEPIIDPETQAEALPFEVYTDEYPPNPTPPEYGRIAVLAIALTETGHEPRISNGTVVIVVPTQYATLNELNPLAPDTNPLPNYLKRRRMLGWAAMDALKNLTPNGIAIVLTNSVLSFDDSASDVLTCVFSFSETME